MSRAIDLVPLTPGLEQDAASAQLQHRLETEPCTVKEVDGDRVLLAMSDGTEVWVSAEFLRMASRQ